LALVKHKIWY